MRKIAKLSLVLLVASAPIYAQAAGADMLELIRGLVKVIGLSPEGTDMLARQSLKRAGKRDGKAIEHIEIAMGEELARPSLDRRRLAALIDQYAVESAAEARRDKEQLVEDASRLSLSDRQKFGRFLSRSSQAELKKDRGVLLSLPW